MRGWLKEGQPACFPLPVFFFPQGFMTGTLQTFARKYQVYTTSPRNDMAEVVECLFGDRVCRGMVCHPGIAVECCRNK